MSSFSPSHGSVPASAGRSPTRPWRAPLRAVGCCLSTGMDTLVLGDRVVDWPRAFLARSSRSWSLSMVARVIMHAW